MKIENSFLEFTSGNTVNIYGGIIGIDSDLRTYYGHDGVVYDEDLSLEDRVELAEKMIGLWTQYKNKIQKGGDQ